MGNATALVPPLPVRRQRPLRWLVVALCLLLALVPTTLARAQEDPPLPPVAIQIPTFQYDSDNDRYLITVGISGVSRVGKLVLLVREAEQGVDVKTVEILPNNEAIIRTEITTENFRAGSKYELRILAFDQQGNQLLRPSDNGDVNPQEQSIWAVQPFTHSPGSLNPVAAQIQTVNADYNRNVIAITLATSDRKPNRFEGFVVAEGGERVLDIPPTLFTSNNVEVPLPEVMSKATTRRKYTLTLVFFDVNGNPTSAERDFAPDPPATMGAMQRLRAGLTRNPMIPATIVIVIFSLVLVSLMRNRPKRASRMSRPPMGQTIHMTPPPPPPQAQAVKPSAAELRPPPPPPPAARLRLRVLQSPGLPGVQEKMVVLPYVVGRAEFPNDRQISREHARIDSYQGQITVMDLGSTNGTFINEQRIAPQQPIAVVRQTQVRFGGGTICELIPDAG